MTVFGTRCATCIRLASSKPVIIFAIILTILCINSSTVNGQQHAQHYSYLNTPPILYVPDRNWIISENEQVGQVIARIRAEDAENDDLVFGLEAHFHTNYADPNENAADLKDEKLPFRIDTEKGVVYLNESLVGRAGEKFFLYITVSDGQLTAKNEVLVNIVGKREQNRKKNRLPTSNIVQNISQFLPPFSSLPGVQSIRHELPNLQQQQKHQQNHRPINNFPTFLSNPSYTSYPSRPSFMPKVTESEEEEQHINENNDEEILSTTTKSQQPLTTTSRTKLMAVTDLHNTHNISINEIIKDHREVEEIMPSSNEYKIKAIVIPIISLCGLIVAIVAITGVCFRRRIFAFGKTLKKKSKEEMAKSSNQSTDDSQNSQNSIVLQHWHGPTAYGNRYVPWEREQQAMATSQLSGNRGEIGANGLSVSEFAGNITAGGHFGNHKLNRWEFPRHRLKFFNILGEGAFGQVWRCEATNIDGFEGVTTVAVKTLKENATEAEKKDLISELEVMKSLEPNVNVVRLLGCCTEKEPIFVIIEYVSKGKLQAYLRSSRAERHYGNMHGKSNILTSGELTSFMYQVAKGMDYLTSRGIIHRDLAARNILITDDHTCKVADFGFARDVITSKIYERKSEGKLPIRWMAIESLYDNIFSVKSDIWSFGILMWEIVTLGSTPYPGMPAADVMRKVREGYRLEKPEHCRRELYNIMFYCWAQDANERPTFSEIVQMLDKLLLTEMDYIELERFPDHNYYNILNLSGEKV